MNHVGISRMKQVRLALVRRRALCLGHMVESLEFRTMMHGGEDHDHDEHDHVERKLPAAYDVLPEAVREMFDETGHISRTHYLTLPAEQQAIINPHSVEDDRSLDEQLSEALTPLPIQAGGDIDYALPDLVPLTSSGYLRPYLDQTEQPGRNLLRFTTAVGNQGTAPAILYSGNTAQWQTPDGRQLVKQRLFTFNGTSFTQVDERDAGKFIFHPTHGHFHLEDYARYRLLDLNGNQVYRDDGTPAIGDKVGFCLVNIATSFTTTSGVSSTTLPGYNRAGQPSTSCGFVQGIHVGRADVYDAQYDGQWIDVTGVPNGSYQLEVTLDAGNALLELNEANNTVRVPVTLNATPPTGGIPLDRFERPVPNNDFTHATDLGELGVATQAGLTMHADVDADYFKFTAASSGSYAVELTVANRIVDLYLYDDQQHELGRDTNPRSGTTAQPVIKHVGYNFERGHLYYIRAEGFSGSDLESGGDTGGRSTNYAVRVLVNPTVVTSAPLATAGEDGAAEGSFHIDRNGPFSNALTVKFAVGGTAVRGVDYDLYYNGGVFTGDTMIIGVESLSETIRVVPKIDSEIESIEDVTLTLLNDSAYVVDTNSSTAVVTLADTAPRATGGVYDPLSNQVSFGFSLDVSASLQPDDLQLVNVDTGEPASILPNDVLWDAREGRASFRLAGALPRGHYRAVLKADGVTHALGAPLGQDAVVRFNYMPADGNLDGVTNFTDLVTLAAHYNKPGTFAQGDYNYDGMVDFTDLVLLAQNYGLTSLPPIGGRALATTATPGAKSKAPRIATSVL